MFFDTRERARENEFRWRSEFGLGEEREPSPKEKIETLLQAVRGGAYNAWIAITWELSQPYTCGTNPLQADLTSVPGWNDFDQSRHAELLEAARGFLFHADPHTSAWLGRNQLPDVAIAGYKALLTLAKVDPKFVASLTISVLKKWAGVIVDYPISDSGDSEDRHNELLHRILQIIPNETDRCIKLILERDQSGADTRRLLRRLDCNDSQLQSFLLEELRRATLAFGTIEEILVMLIEKGVKQASGYAEEMLFKALRRYRLVRENLRDTEISIPVLARILSRGGCRKHLTKLIRGLDCRFGKTLYYSAAGGFFVALFRRLNWSTMSVRSNERNVARDSACKLRRQELARFLKTGTTALLARIKQLVVQAEEELGKAVILGHVLVLYTSDADWHVVWPLVAHCEEFARWLFLRLADPAGLRDASSVCEKLNEHHQAELYVPLNRFFPPSQDPVHYRARMITPREEVARWRSSLISILSNRGSKAALEEIRRIAAVLPEQNFSWALLNAEVAMLRSCPVRRAPYRSGIAHFFLVKRRRMASVSPFRPFPRRSAVVYLIIWSYCWRTSSQSIGLLRISCRFACASAFPISGRYNFWE
jgi:hypothetical protein